MKNNMNRQNNKIEHNNKINILNLVNEGGKSAKFECSNPEHHNIGDKICHFQENILDKNKCNFPIPIPIPSAPPSYNDVDLKTYDT